MKAQVPFLLTDTFIDAYVKPYYSEGHRFYFKYDYIEKLLDYCKNKGLRLTPSQNLALQFLYTRWCPIFPDYLERGAKLLKYIVQTASMEINHDVLTAQQIINELENKDTLTDKSKLIYDLDRIRFAASQNDYERYERLIRFEFSHIDDKTWVAGRINLLTNMLNSGQIFVTPQFQNEFENSARQNITQQIDKLKESLSDV
ncbi:MAG: hypothetical protein D6B28_03820 [Gammaproteobacteria bacterium]|nr:MAG: hypothetical protein D6B28_03820 [Gammaproteobacteria bacterium]